MPVLSVDDCTAEAVRLLAKVPHAANDDERLQLLRRATMWLEEAKLRAVEQWAPASEGSKGGVTAAAYGTTTCQRGPTTRRPKQ